MQNKRVNRIRSIVVILLCCLLSMAGCGSPRETAPQDITPTNAPENVQVPASPAQESVSPAGPSGDSPAPAITAEISPESSPAPSVAAEISPGSSPAPVITKEMALKNLEADFEELSIRDSESIKGSLYLPDTGSNGSSITWASSNPEVISDNEIENPGYDATPKGVVVRQAEDTAVTLTATLSNGGHTAQKEFSVTVMAAPSEQEYTDYLFAYFIGNGRGEESVFFSVSQDGLQWEELNGQKPVLTSALGTKGLRDPFLIRSAEGDRFFLIATDLCIASDGDWWRAQTNGSLSIMIWESEDLVHWSDQRMVEVNQPSAGCTWAPEAYYDEITGEYLVFWASRIKDDSYAKQRIYYVKTRDFYTFTAPKLWIDYPFSTIDTTVIRDAEYYYRFTKYEDKSLVIMERAETLLGEWTKLESASLAKQSGVEGPCCYALNPEDAAAGSRYVLLLDNYGGGGYYVLTSETLSEGEFTRKRGGVVLPASKPRHGTVISLTREEYERILSFYNH